MNKKYTIIHPIIVLIIFIFMFFSNFQMGAGGKENLVLSSSEELMEKTTMLQVEETTILTEEITKIQTTILETECKKIENNSNFGIFKSYTDYRCLSRSSPQWKLQEQAYTDENGLRKIGNAYLVALGSYYGTRLGTKYEVSLSNGNKFNIILCDCKNDKHTDKKNQSCLVNGSVLEFYVEIDKLPARVKNRGTVGALDFFNGSIVSIEKIV